jgi:hypothetical protein
MVFNATFNNISVIWWLSVLLAEETGETTPTCRKSRDKCYHKMLYRIQLAMIGNLTQNCNGDRH